MEPETRIALLKELENIKRIRSRSSYSGAWIGLLVSILWISQIVDAMSKPGWSSVILNWSMMVFALALLLQSFYVIIRHVSDRRMVLIIEALLESKRSLAESPEEQNRF